MGKLAPTIGLAISDTRCSPTTLRATGAGVRDSAYTEAGPIPGHPVPTDTASRWRPQIRGAQSVSLTALTIHGGFPGRDPAAGIVYRLASDTDQGDYRGWAEPNLVTDWTAPAEYQDEDWTYFASTAIPNTSRMTVVAIPSSGSAAQTWSYDIRTGTWTALYDWSTGPGLRDPITMAYDTVTSRLLLWSGDGAPYEPGCVAYQSDDEGLTWTIYSRGIYDESVAGGDNASVAVDPDGDWVMFVDNKQFASSDSGVSWELIADVSAGAGGLDFRVVKVPAGFLVSYNRNADSNACVRFLPSARSPFTSAATVVVAAIAADDVNLACDHDGSAYLYASGPTDGQVTVYRSDDSGTTWGVYLGGLTGAAGAVGIGRWTNTIPLCGSLVLIGSHIGAPTEGIHALVMGGYAQVDQGYYGASGAFNQQRLSRWGYSVNGLLYLPYDTPANQGWTTTSTGTISMSPAGSDVGLSLITTGVQVSQHSITVVSGTAVGWGCGGAKLRVISGPVAASSNVFIAMTLLDSATTGGSLQIRIGTDGIEVRDGSSTVRATASLTTSTLTHYRWQIRQTGAADIRASVWYKQGNGTAWTRVADEVTITSAALGANAITFGHAVVGAGAAETIWHYCGGIYYADWRYELPNLAGSNNTPADEVLGLSAGRPVPGRGAAYPIPDATTTSEDLGHITAVGGPTYVSETVSLPADHTYDLDHVYPDVSASPRVEWRSTDASAVELVWDQGSGNETFYGGAMALPALNANFRTAVLEVDDGGGGWTTLGTLDKGWSSINYTLTGRTAVPRSGTATLARYYAEGELVGGYMVLSTAGTSVARRIIAQSAGYWTTDTALQRMRIVLEDVDGSETAAGTGEIVHHSGVLVCYPSASVAGRYLQVRIAASQITPGGYYGAGILHPHRVVGFGADPGWDWSDITEYSRTTTRAADGSLSVRRRGPPRRVLTNGWTDGVHLIEMRTLAAAADYVGVQNNVAFGTEEDAWSSPLGLIEHQLRSGEVPAIVLRRLPTTDGTTITDPSLYVYGVLSSDSVGLSGVTGTEGVDEAIRVDGITFEERR